MTVSVEPIEDPDRWNALVERADAGTPFHRYEALEVFATHTGTRLHALVGRVGREPVGVFPIFELRIGPARAAFSPPPNRKISYLGPATTFESAMNYRKRERRHRRFVDAALEYVDAEIDPRIVNLRTAVEYGDPRPFLWNGFESTPRYTYHLDLSRDPATVLSAAGRDLRSNVRRTDAEAYEIDTGGSFAIERVIGLAKRRHQEQGVPYAMTPEFVDDLARAMPEHLTVYVCRVDDSFAGGTVVLSDDRTCYRWQSATDFDVDVPVQDLLDWRVIQDGIDAGRSRYDLVGANNPRLCRYKAKFAPRVATYYRLERSGPVSGLLASAYGRLK